jgi:divalent metal cation (Fe/Co/Zn/Cd) transporter
MSDRHAIQKLGYLTLGVNIGLMLVKIITGLVGNCYALVAEGHSVGHRVKDAVMKARPVVRNTQDEWLAML